MTIYIEYDKIPREAQKAIVELRNLYHISTDELLKHLFVLVKNRSYFAVGENNEFIKRYDNGDYATYYDGEDKYYNGVNVSSIIDFIIDLKDNNCLETGLSYILKGLTNGYGFEAENERIGNVYLVFKAGNSDTPLYVNKMDMIGSLDLTTYVGGLTMYSYDYIKETLGNNLKINTADDEKGNREVEYTSDRDRVIVYPVNKYSMEAVEEAQKR